MARTLIGQLVLMLKDDASGKAKAAATSIDQSLRRIETAQKRLAAAPWGAGMQKQLDTLRASSKEIRLVEHDWTRLQNHIKSNNLSKALARSEVSRWRAATVGAFAQVRAEARATHTEISRLSRLFNGGAAWLGKAALISMGGYTSAYLGSMAMRGGFGAWADQRREFFRQEMAGLTAEDRQKILRESLRLSGEFPSVSTTESMELARTARNLMGDTDRGNQILETLVKGLVVLQSTKGVDAATSEMNRLQRGLDILGVNAAGDLGIEQVRSVIEGVIRAAQVEGRDLDAGDLFKFAGRASLSGTAMAPEFLANVAPAFIQQWGADQAGTAFQSAYRALVIGSKDNASKANLAEQRRLGIRIGPGHGELIAAKLYGENPYAWAKQYLVPALEKAGVDLTDNTQVAQAVGKIARAGNAQKAIAQMVIQQEQFDKNIEQYLQAHGTSAAPGARYKNPWVAIEGFTKAWGELATAVGGKGTVLLTFLNETADGISWVAKRIKENPELQRVVGLGGLGIAGLGAGFAVKGAYSLFAAGPQLQVAAFELQAAAAALGGAGAVDGIPGKAGRRLWSRLGGLALPVLGLAGTAYGTGRILAELSDANNAENRRMATARGAERGSMAAWRKYYESGAFEHDAFRASQERERRRSEAAARGAEVAGAAGIPIPKPRPDYPTVPLPRSRPDFTGGRDIYRPWVGEAEVAGRDMESALNVTAAPQVDTSSIRDAVTLAERLKAILEGIGALSSRVSASVQSKVNQVYADQGPMP